MLSLIPIILPCYQFKEGLFLFDKNILNVCEILFMIHKSLDILWAKMFTSKVLFP